MSAKAKITWPNQFQKPAEVTNSDGYTAGENGSINFKQVIEGNITSGQGTALKQMYQARITFLQANPSTPGAQDEITQSQAFIDQITAIQNP